MGEKDGGAEGGLMGNLVVTAEIKKDDGWLGGSEIKRRKVRKKRRIKEGKLQKKSLRRLQTVL